MDYRRPVELSKAYLLMNHGPVTLVSAAHDGVRNVMAASWAMPLDFSPPKVAVVIDKSAFTRQLIEASGQFALNIPARKIAQHVLAVGSHSGHDMDKFAALGIKAESVEGLEPPLIDGCVAWLSCSVVPEPHNQQRYDLFIGEVTAAWADSRVFSEGRWQFPEEGLRTLHYLAGGSFMASGDMFEVAL